MHRQSPRLAEPARISDDEIRTHAVFATVQLHGNLGDPATPGDALHGPYFTRCARHRSINLLQDQLKLFNSPAYLNTVDYPAQRPRNGGRHSLTGAFKGPLKVP